MQEINSISQTIRIKNHQIKLNEEIVFSLKVDSVDFISNAYKHFEINYPKFYKMDLMSKAGFLAAELLLKNETIETINEFKKGILLQNSSSSLLTDINYQETLNTIPSPALFVYTLPNIVMGEIAIRHNFKGENTFLVAEKFDAKQLVEYATILLNENIVNVLLLGFIEINEKNQDILICLIDKQKNNLLTIENLQNLYEN